MSARAIAKPVEYDLRIEQDETGAVIGDVAILPGCYSEGGNKNEALANGKDSPTWTNGTIGEIEVGRVFSDRSQARVLANGLTGAVFNGLLHGDTLVSVCAATRDPILIEGSP